MDSTYYFHLKEGYKFVGTLDIKASSENQARRRLNTHKVEYGFDRAILVNTKERS